jgi:hypothetical protein
MMTNQLTIVTDRLLLPFTITYMQNIALVFKLSMKGLLHKKLLSDKDIS